MYVRAINRLHERKKEERKDRLASKLAQIGLWVEARKFRLVRLALLIFACALMVLAITMLMQVNSTMSRAQQLATQMISAQEKAEVLILCSYDETDSATALQRDGALDLLERSSVAADVEYLDAAGSNGTYRTAADLANSSWGKALAQKIASHGNYSCILCLDDDALAYIAALRAGAGDTASNSTLTTTPVVFAGVTNQTNATKAFDAGYATGLVEAYDAAAIMQAAVAMRPSATKALVICDATTEGTGVRTQVMKAADSFSGLSVDYLNASALPRADLAKAISAAGANTIVLYLGARSDSSNKTYTADQSAYFVSESASVPVFSAVFTGVGEGFAGSGFIDYTAEGSRAAELVVQVLNGTSTNDIPLTAVSNEDTVFDAAVLDAYNIDKGLVPAGATMLNNNGLIETMQPILLPIVLLVLAVICMLAYAYLGYRRTVSNMASNMEALVSQRNVFEERFYTDNLTDMPNMQWLTAFAGSSESAQVKSVIEVALRDMDTIDETRGKGTADEIVKVLADRLDGLDKVFLVRPAANEFILGIDRELEPGGVLLDELGYLLSQPVDAGEHFIAVDSCVSVFNREPGMSIEEMVSGVDIAVHQAEELGIEDEVIFYDHDMRTAVENKLEITSELKRQIEREQFIVLYQPQVELDTNEVVGFEALVRMHDNEFAPDTFIPVAEMTGQIIDIDRIVAKKVVQQLARWKKRKQRIRAMSINYSSSMRDEGYIDYVAGLLAEFDIPTSTLRFDIKESLFISNMQKANAFVEALRARGFGIAIDGFGAGYTSISRVMQLPADVVKIDRSLTANFLSGHDDGVIANLVRLVHSAGKIVVIQGVETAEQLAKCRAMGCDVVQGYYYAEPLLPERALQYKPLTPESE